MGVYGGIQLPNINEENLDNKKERKQILNYLALLDEKLRYMFQNIDIEENLSADAQERFFQYGKDITNLIKDTEGNFSAFKQSIDGITLQVQDLEGNHALLQQTADGLISAVGSVEGSVSLLQQEAARIETEVQNLDGEVSTLTQTADGLSSTVKKLQDDVAKNASSITQTAEQIRSEVSATSQILTQKVETDVGTAKTELGAKIEADIGAATTATNKKIDDDIAAAKSALEEKIAVNSSSITQTATEIRSEVSQQVTSLNNSINSLDVDSVRSVAEQAADHFSWIVKSGSSSSSIALTSNMIKAIANQVNIEADVNLYGKMTVYKDSGLDSKGGYIGYGTIDDLYNGTTKGIMMQDSSKTASFCASSSGCGMVAEGDDDTFGVYLYYYNGNFMPYVKNEQMLGDPSYKWQGVYASNGTIQTSDEREKENITYDMDRYEEFYSMLKPAWYQMVNGQSGRTHVGFISQDIEIALRESGLTDMDFAGFIKSPLYGEDENGLPKHEGEVVDYAYSLRYGEFIALNTHMIQKLMARVSDLENKLEALS